MTASPVGPVPPLDVEHGPEATGALSTWKPSIEVRGGRGRLGSAAFVELWLFRGVLAAFAVRYVKIKYKQAAIGLGWAVLQPIAAAAIFAVFLGHLANVGSEGAPYFVFSLAGMAAWTYFSNASTAGSESLVYHEALLRKVYFPREILPLAAVTAGLLDLVPSLATLGIAAAVFGRYPSLTWIVLPLPVLLLVMSAVAASLALSALNVFYRDVRYALPFVLQLALFATPVVYSLGSVPGHWRSVYAVLDPVAAVIDSLRRIVIHSAWPSFGILGLAFLWTAFLGVSAYAVFKWLERDFADRV